MNKQWQISDFPLPIRSYGILVREALEKFIWHYHENLRKQVIVKKVKDHCVDIMDSRIEVDILKNLHHRYLPQVYDFIQVNGGIYTVMDYIPGYDLEYYCNRQMHFSEEQLLFWMQQLLEVLDYLHTRKPPILHCDHQTGKHYDTGRWRYLSDRL